MWNLSKKRTTAILSLWKAGMKNIAHILRWWIPIWVGTAQCVTMGVSDAWSVSIGVLGVSLIDHARYLQSRSDEYRDLLQPYFDMDSDQVERNVRWWSKYVLGGLRFMGLVALVAGVLSAIAVRRGLFSSFGAVTGRQLGPRVTTMVGILMFLNSHAIIGLTPEGSVWRQRSMLFLFRASGVVVILTGMVVQILIR